MPATKRNNGLKGRWRRTVATAAATLYCSAPATAVEIAAGDWKFNANGNVNVHYINSSCEEETTAAVAGGLACIGSFGEDYTSRSALYAGTDEPEVHGGCVSLADRESDVAR